MPLRAVLFDVGGTLLREETYLLGTTWDERRVQRLREALGRDEPWFPAVARLPEPEEHEGQAHRQETRIWIRSLLLERGVSATDEEVERIRAACCVPSLEGERPRDGALEALRWCKARGLKVALVTNVLWRTAAESLADWTARGAADCIDTIVTSLDAHWRKPHPAMFELALSELHLTPPEAVMVGNSRAADVAPAKALGLRAVLIRSAEGSTSETQPDAVIDEMTELPAVLERWL